MPLQEGRRRKREKERQKQHLSLRAIRNFSPAAQAATTVERRRRRAEPHARCTVEASLFAPPKHEEEEGEIEEGSRRARCVQGEKDPSAAALSRFALWFPCFSGIKGWGKESERTMCAASSSVSLGGLSGSPTTRPRDERETFPNANPLSPPALRRTF